MPTQDLQNSVLQPLNKKLDASIWLSLLSSNMPYV